MQGLSIDDLRTRGATIRHARGFNTCVRCLNHFQPSNSSLVSEDCMVHVQELNMFDNGNEIIKSYPCCKGSPESTGCVPAAHLPMFQMTDGKVNPERRVEYDPSTDLKVGRWSSTRVNLTQMSGQPSPSVPPMNAATSSVTAAAAPMGQPGDPVPRAGDEIMVCGQLYHTGTPVILWGDADGGYDHYRVERRFCPFAEADWATTQKENPTIFTTPNRFGLRKDGLTDAEVERVRGGQWPLELLQKQMTQFVLHFDEAGLSQQCFKILQDERDLSIHFMLDIDGTIYQALDLKERAWQATTSNTCSVGIEIANIGAYDPSQPVPFPAWYTKDASGKTIITIPPEFGNGGVHTPNFVGSPARPEPVLGIIQGQKLVQYDYTPQQYVALSKLLATFCTIFPNIPLDYPKDASGKLIPQKLPDAQLQKYTGILGHYHIQTNKVDPGPAMQWDLLMDGARKAREEARIARLQAQATKQMQKMTLATAASSPSSSSSSSTSSSSASQVNEWNLMRKMERKLLTAAEESSASQLGSNFYLVEMGWWSHFQQWLACTDLSITRPSNVTNHLLLDSDERTPRDGLVLGRDYKAVGRNVWTEIVDLYGPATPIIRQSGDIYAMGNARSFASSSSSSCDF